MSAPVVIGSPWHSVTPAQLADALAPADPALCGWLDGSCKEPPAEDHWLCTSHAKRITAGA